MADQISVPAVDGGRFRRTDPAWAPLGEPLFRSLWIAAVVSYTGTWMQNVGAGWLMTQLSSSPLMVSLVQAAAAIPVFLVVLPAGALADMVDRRRLLLFTQSWMIVAAVALGILTLFNAVSPWMLLVFTFVMGLGAVMNDPAWQAITPEVVSPARHASAVALNSAGFNVARAVGPALGGVVVAVRRFWMVVPVECRVVFRSHYFSVHMETCSAKAAGHQRSRGGDYGGPALRTRRSKGEICIDPDRCIQRWRYLAPGSSSGGLSAAWSARLRLLTHMFRTWRFSGSRRATQIAVQFIRWMVSSPAPPLSLQL